MAEDFLSVQEVPEDVARPLPDLEDINEKILSIKEKIKQLQIELYEAVQTRGQLEIEVDKYRAAVAPIRRKPPEILAVFFEYYVELNTIHIRRLILVCKLWHQVGMSTPPLFTYIELNI